MLDINEIRAQFPALASGAIHFDNPGGTQIARQSMQRIQDYYLRSNANHGGLFPTSLVSDGIIKEARQAIADWLNAARPEEIIFGPNMTSLTLHMSRSHSSIPAGQNSTINSLAPPVRLFDTWSSSTLGPYSSTDTSPVYDYSSWNNATPSATALPLKIKITALRIILRVWDEKSERTRQVTIVQDM